ncbi:MAG: tRNA (adenosine(37)-N6)-threonylcarbamoyltransferase complex ATPase subunit type 1 TsaE [Clostridia bacterium]|nr:tRNA (adenosine(37)-N6)-threonylcarbamoyltransferase complex ATPase subunit type 1 TsaE [Clostridia bacterium]
MIYYSSCAQDTEEIGRKLAARLEDEGVTHAFIAMRGEMGVGKTAFTRGFASHFGIKGVKSPTYTIVNEYAGRRSVFHFDMYRIENDDDLYSIDFDGYTAREGYIIAEWSENIDDFIPDDAIFVTILRTDGADGRKIMVE